MSPGEAGLLEVPGAEAGAWVSVLRVQVAGRQAWRAVLSPSLAD